MVNPLRDGASQILRGRKDNLKLLRHEITSYDSLHIIASCGALSLMPENASRLFRIEALAHVAGTLGDTPLRNRITDVRLRRLFHEPPLSGAIKKAEDPFPNVFVEEVPFFSGPQLIFPGPGSGTNFEFRRLSECIFRNKYHWPAGFIARAGQIFRGTLALSNVLAKRVGLERGTLGDSSEKGDVTIPDTARFQAMREAVTFSRSEFESCLAENGVEAEDLAELVVNIGEFRITDHSISNGILVHKPIIRGKNQFVIAAPQRLLAAANQLVLRDIARANLQNIFVRSYSDAVVSSVHRSLDY